MEVIEFNSKILNGKYLSLPPSVIAKIKNSDRLRVVVKWGQDRAQDESNGEKVRMKAAFDEYKAKYPDDKVTLEDFRYVGVLPVSPPEQTKDELIDAIEAKYNDLCALAALAGRPLVYWFLIIWTGFTG